MDLEKEISKCEKKLDLARLNLQKIVKIESQPEYEETVPANVRTANDDKVWSILLVFLIFSNHCWNIFLNFIFVVHIEKNHRSGNFNVGDVKKHVHTIEIGWIYIYKGRYCNNRAHSLSP